MVPADVDSAVRLAAFEFLRRQEAQHDHGLLPFKLLERGFDFRSTRVPLVSQQGIFKWLRNAHRFGVWLAYFHAVAPGLYAAAYPAIVVQDDPAARRVRIQVDVAPAGSVSMLLDSDSRSPESDSPAGLERRRYVTSVALRRLHQESFRQRILGVYQESCAVCRLRRRELLEAAHIVPDRLEGGEPVTSNGLSLCDLHHKAFDRNLIGVRPDLRIVVRRDVLDEEDGPMLIHGLKGFHDRPLQVVPRRFAEFEAAAS